MKGYNLISRFFIIKDGDIKEVKLFKKQPLLWRYRWWVFSTIMIAITIYKIKAGHFQF